MSYLTGYTQGYYETEDMVTLQDQLRGEQTEVADTGFLLTQAADRIDILEAELAVAGDPIRLAAVEAAIDLSLIHI